MRLRSLDDSNVQQIPNEKTLYGKQSSHLDTVPLGPPTEQPAEQQVEQFHCRRKRMLESNSGIGNVVCQLRNVDPQELEVYRCKICGFECKALE